MDEAQNPKNVIVIMTDQLSAKWLGCYGDPAASTPNLDAMAARAARFDCCCANQPVCMPSRASSITGRGPQHHGVYYNSYELGLDLPTYPQVLRQAGFQTFGVGKFHLECHGRSARNDVTKYGFDRAETTEDIRAGDWLDWVEETYPQHYDRALSTVWGGGYLPTYGSEERKQRVAVAKQRFKPDVKTETTYPCVVPEEATQTRWVVERSLGFLRERERRRPFFLQMSFVGPHNPYEPPERFLDRIDPDRIGPPVRSEDPSLLGILDRFTKVPIHKRLGATDWAVARHYYHAFMAFIDEQIGRLFSFLADEGIADDTYILFTADHGDMLGDHGMHTKGAWHFDACIRVPLLVCGPGVRPRTVRRAVSNLDLFPTIADLAGVEHEVPLEGESLCPLLKGGDDLGRPDAVLVETYGSYAVLDRELQAWTARTPDAAFTLFGDGEGMLFDLARDPDERTNLFGRADSAELEREMRDQLLALMTRCYHPLSRRRKHPKALH